MTDVDSRQYNPNMDRPTDGGEIPVTQRPRARTMVPLSWLNREVSVDYLNSHGHATSTKGTLIDWCPLGLILVMNGARTIVSFDRLVLLELRD